MNSEKGRIYYGIGLDNEQLRSDAREAKNVFGGIADSAEKDGRRMDKMLRNVALGIGTAFSVQQAFNFAKAITKVRGEIESLEISLETLLGSKQKANVMVSEIMNWTATTPMEFQNVAKGAQTLLAFNIAGEKVMPTLKQIGDISMGDANKFSSLTLAFAQMSSTGRLMGQDLLQMINAGFNPLTIISEETGKSIAQLKKEMEGGAISAEMVAKAFETATAEGGKFNGMLERQGKGIVGLKANFDDAITNQMNKFGKANEELIKGFLKGSISIVENIDEIGKAILEIVAVYGTYKAALIAINAIRRVNITILRQAIVEKKLAAMAGIQLSNAEALAAARTKLLAAAQKGLMASLKATAGALVANPYVLAAAAIAGVAFAIYKVVTAESAFDKANKRLSDATKEVESNVAAEITKLTSLERKLSEAKKGTDEYEKIKAAIVKNYGQYYQGLEGEIERVGSLAGVYGKLTEAIRMSIGQRQFESFFKTEQENIDKVTGESLDKAYETLTKKYGKDEGMKLYQQFFDSVIRGAEMSKDTQDKLRKATFVDWFSSPTGFSIENVTGLQAVISTASKASEKAIEDFKIKYQLTEKQVSDILYGDKNKEDEPTFFSSLKQIVSEIKTAEKALEDLRKKAAKGDVSVEDVEKQVGVIDTLKKQYETISGKEYGKKAADDLTKDIITLSEKIAATQGELEQSRIAAMKEGRDKEIEEIRFSTKQKIEEINKEEKELAEAAKKAGKKLSSEESGGFSVLRRRVEVEGSGKEEEVNRKYFDQLKDRQDELTSIFLTDEERKEQAIKDRYDKERKWAAEMVEGGGMDSTQYAAFLGLAFMAEQEANLQAFKEKYKTVADQITDIEKQAQEDRKKATTDGQRAMVDDWEKAQKSRIVSDEMLKDPAFASIMGNLDKVSTAKINESLVKAREMANEAFKSGKLTATDMKTIVETIERAEQEVKDRNPFKALGKAIKAYREQPKGEKDIKDIALNAAAAFQIVEGSLSAVIGGLKEMGIAGDEETQALLGSFVELAGSASSLAAGIASMNPVQIISGAIGVITSLFDIFDKKSRDAARRIREHEEAIKRLQKEYNALEQAIKKAISTDYYQKQVEQAKNLEEQIIELYGKIEDERSKRKRKQNQEQIESWQNEIVDLRNQAADIRQAVIDELSTTDLRSFSSSLASSIIDGYVEGMDDLSGVVDESMDKLMRDMIAKQFDAFVVQKMMEPVFKAIENSLNVDNGDFIFDEKDMRRIKAASEIAKKNLLTGGEAYKKMLEDLGLMVEDERSAVEKKGLAQASQESIDELGGRMTAIQGHTYSLTESVKTLVANSNRILMHLAGIENNTKDLSRLENIESGIGSMKSTLDEISIKGVKWRS